MCLNGTDVPATALFSYMLTGDFNGHNILWGCKDNNPKGNFIKDFITKNESYTYLRRKPFFFTPFLMSIYSLVGFDWAVIEIQL